MSKEMALMCPHVIWKIFPFNSTNSVTKPFEFLNCHWRWEYFVHTTFRNLVPEEIVVICLKRLTKPSAYSSRKVSTIVSMKGSEGKHNDVSVMNMDVSPLVKWCVWRKPKSYILLQNVVQDNSCSFSLTLEPVSFLEDLNSFSNDENYDTPCLQELSKDFDKLLKCSKHADIILKSNGTEIKGHKDVLRFRSKKLADMIEKHGFEDTSVENVQIIRLESMEPGVFEALLRFIYTSTLPDLRNELNLEEIYLVIEVYDAADEYGIDSLKKKCAQLIIEQLCNSNALHALEIAHNYDDDYLVWAVASFIACDFRSFSDEQKAEWQWFNDYYQSLAWKVYDIREERSFYRRYIL